MALYTHTQGSGPALVLVHGWGMHGGIWGDVVAGLVDRYQVTVLDLPGHGYSQPYSGGQTLSAWADLVLAAVPSPAIWVGWSLGGLVAQQAALTAPQAIERLVLVSSTPCFVQRPDWPHGMALPVLQRFAAELRQDYRPVLQRFIALEVHGSEQATTQLRHLKALLFQHGEPEVAALEQGLVLLETSDLRSRLAEIHCPTLLLMGQRDQLVPAGAGRAMLQQLPNGRLHTFERAGHAPFFSHLAAFIGQLGAFVDGG